MRYENIGGIRLPKIGLGTSRIGGRIIPDRSRDVHWLNSLCHALDLGYTHVDTAELYALGYSEALIGRAIRAVRASREQLFITTKVWPVHLRAGDVVRSCDGSLRRLATEYIDLYLIHLPNPWIPLAETFGALNALRRQGKIRHIGVSNFGLERLAAARGLAEAPIITNQVRLSLFDQARKKDGMVAYCQKHDILVTAYSPLRHAQIRQDAVLKKIAAAHAATPHQIALAWLVHQPGVITIPMSVDPVHQEENLRAGDLELEPDELKLLECVSGA